MDKFQLQYSKKNIPVPSQNSYFKCLIAKTESFINRLRWKAFFYDRNNTNDDGEKDEKFGFRTENSPPSNAALSGFESDIHDLIQRINFRKHENEFQTKLKNDVQKIKNSDKIIVAADKSTNLYKMSSNEYRKIVQENVTKEYKKAPIGCEEKINQEALTVVTKLKLDDRVQGFSTGNCYVTLKDHKDNFYSNPQCRLINPAKSQIGRISKQILGKIVSEMKVKTQLPLWKNTYSVLEWFKKIEKGRRSKFIQFDIEAFYPSISKSLLDKALNYAQSIVNVSTSDMEIIHHARKSLLYNDEECWVKKGRNLFDVTMGAYDGAEVCELVGLYLLKKITLIIPVSQVGLYRDDGLAAMSNTNGQKLDRIRKKLHECFKEENLKITIQINMTEVDFLDVHLCIKSGNFRPYSKPNNTLQYIHMDSNHPKNIKKNIPAMVEKRLSSLSKTQEIFEEEKFPYEEALKQSGYSQRLSYQQSNDTHRKRNRQRKILWFNPPFSENVATNVGREFLKIVEKNFPVNHKYNRIFNKNTVKVSYSCMNNMENIIKSHNMSILHPKEKLEDKTRTCNCRNKNTCPLDGKGLAESLVYEGTISNSSISNGEKFKYIGQAEGEFKTRLNNHNTSFRKENYSTKTELSKKFWEITSNGGTPKITWKILKMVKSYENGHRHCDLCLTEKLLIMKCKDKNLLNSRSEISSKCRHKRKFLLANLT